MKLYIISPTFASLEALHSWIADESAINSWIAEASVRDWMSEEGLEEILRSYLELEDLGQGLLRIEGEYCQIFFQDFSWEEFDQLMEG